MYCTILVFCLGFASGYYFKKEEKKIILNGISLLTLLNQWSNDIEDYFTYNYIIKEIVYLGDSPEYISYNHLDINENGIQVLKELKPLPLIVYFNYKKASYVLKLKNANQINEVEFKSNGKSIKKFLSIMVDNKEVLQELKMYAGPFENFYCLPEVTFDNLFPGCEKIDIINEFGDLETFKGNVNIISLI
jgi:hypothetical protein